MLILKRKIGEGFTLETDTEIQVTFLGVKNQEIKMAIQAPHAVEAYKRRIFRSTEKNVNSKAMQFLNQKRRKSLCSVNR